MEFTPKKQPGFGSGSLRSNPYSTGGRSYIKRFKKRSANVSTPRLSLATPPRTSLQNRFSRAERIVNNSSKIQTKSDEGSNLGKWKNKNEGASQATKRPFSAVNGIDNSIDPYHVLSDSENDTLEISNKSNSLKDSSVFSDTDNEIIERKNKAFDKENSLFGPSKSNSVKVYTNKKKSFNLSRSRLLCDVSPEKIERAYGPRRLSGAEKENIPTDTKADPSIIELTSPHLIGFPNYGNTCYLNSVIQSLFGLPSFLGDFQLVASQLGMPHTSLSFGLSQVLSSRMKGQVSGVKQSLKTVKENLERVDGSFSGFKMQDANEFLTRVLDTMKDEIDRCHMTTPSPDRLLGSQTLVSTSKKDLNEDVCLSGIGAKNGFIYPSSLDFSRDSNINGVSDVVDSEVINDFEELTKINGVRENCKVLDTEAGNNKSDLVNIFGKRPMGGEIMNFALQSVTPKKTCDEVLPRNPVKDNFEFQLLESYRCLGCGDVVGRRQEYFGLYVNLPGEGQESIQDSISSYMGSDERELKCEKCGHTQSSVVTSITSLPRVLIVQLKRYEYKPEQCESVKMSSRVRVNRWISLDSYMTSDGSGPSHWQPQVGSCVTPRTPKQPTLTVRNLSSELNMCDGKKEEEQLPDLVSPAKPFGSATASATENEDEELQEVMRRSMEDIGGVQEEDEIQQAIRLSLQEMGMSYIQENQGDSAEFQSDDVKPKTPNIKDNPGSDRHTYRLISVISHFGLTTNTGHYVSDVYNCNEDNWFHYDDESVAKIPESVVCAEGRQKNGYIFFYMHQCFINKPRHQTTEEGELLLARGSHWEEKPSCQLHVSRRRRRKKMSMSFIEFESARKKDEQRQWEREARQAVLEKAKNSYEAKVQKEEAARQRGEHTWMLTSVESKLDSHKQDKKKKKKEKKKKKKKEKKAKKSKKKCSSSSSSSDTEEEEGNMWVEKCAPNLAKAEETIEPGTSRAEKQNDATREPPKRDSWMEMTSLFGTFSRDEMREREGTSRKKAKEEEEKRKREADKPGSHSRELNPYFKNGGSGLPEEEAKEETSTGSVAIGLDAAWLHKALRRAQEQAKLENTSLEEIAAQRWGSLAKFHELLAEAEGRGKKNQADNWQRMKRTRSRSRERFRSRSRERVGSKNRSKSNERQSAHNTERRSRNKEEEYYEENSRKYRKQSRERSKSRERERSRSKERRRGRRCSSSRSSDSDSKNCSEDKAKPHKWPSNESRRSVKDLLRPPGDNYPAKHSSLLSSKFRRPDESETRSPSSVNAKKFSTSNRGWQKTEYKQALKEREVQSQQKSSSSSSSSELSDLEEESSKGRQRTLEREAPINSVDVPAQPPASPQPPAHLLTDKEMNELAAKIMKAELIGNDVQANKLKTKLEAARAARASGSAFGEGTKESGDQTTEQIVVLTRMDTKGGCRPISGADQEAGVGRRKQIKTHGQDGKRTRYFPDDDQHDLKRMFEREKGTSADDQNSMFEQAAMKNSERLNDDYDMDDMFMSKVALKDTAAKQAERDRLKAIQEHKRSERSMESCQWCFDSKDMPKHLIVALGSKSYVCLPPHESLTPGHCLIVSIHHIPSSVQADEDLWSEIQDFRKSLVKMFNSRDEDCIFFETVKKLKYYPHMALNCVPLPKEMGDMAPIYFKKAIMECEAEWSQNKKLVDLKNRDVRRAVPKGLPYFFVDFAMDPGFAHVIEDEKDFPNNFAQEIVGGMLDLDNKLWRKPRRENFDAQRKKVMEFSRWYKEFDPTQDD
nr:CWF19-like protein 2 [Procambarus clarkii]